MSKQVVIKTTKRIDTLLASAARAFDDGRDPFCESWLSENKVTLDECQRLGSRIATIIKGYLASSERMQNEITVRGLLSGSVAAEAIEMARNSKRMTDVLSDLDRAMQQQ